MRPFPLLPLLLSSVVLLGSFSNLTAAPRLVSGDGLNLRLSEVKGKELTVTPETPGFAHNWWAGRLDGLTPNAPVTVKVDMKGNDTLGNKASVAKWNGLRPMYTYGDPARYETYVGYLRRPDGVWYSTDPFLEGSARFAGNAVVPRQNAVHPQLAAAFLSKDGASWFPWAEIEDAKPGKSNTFVFTQTFLMPTATVAMRVPFTHTYLTQFIARLKAAQWGGVFVDEAGKSMDGRPLWCVRVEDPLGEEVADRKTVVVFAREHATEHATSWSAIGLLLRLLDRSTEMDELRRKVRFIVVPLQDPDGATISRFEGQTERWDEPKNNPRFKEVLAYSGYFRDLADKGQTIDLSVSIHNVEANEADNFSAPFAQPFYRNATVAFNQPLFEAMRNAGYTASKPEPGGSGAMTTRLYGWLAFHLGAMDLAYEVNDRDPESRLSVAQLGNMGAILGEKLGNWILSDSGEKRHLAAKTWLAERTKKRDEFYLQNAPRDQIERNVLLLTRGF